MREYRKDDEKPSEMFINALSGCGIGSDHLECGWCGRKHYCPDNTDNWDDSDGGISWKQYCENEYKENPEGVILHEGYDAVSAHEMNGIFFVIDCPCNGLTRFEKFMWEHRDTFRNYIKVRIEQEYEWAEQELTKNKLAGVSQ